MNKFLNSVFFITLIFSLSACATSSTDLIADDDSNDSLNVKFTIIEKGIHSNISLANQLVIKNQKDWQRLLKIHENSVNTKLATIDFSDKMVIAVFAGQQPSGGYSVGVSNIKRIDDNLFITLTFNEPGKNDRVSLALTQPYLILTTEQVDGKIIFLANKK